MANATKSPIFFLGATGGCTLATLIHTLQAGYPCIAIVRTPEILTTLLKNAGIPESTLASLLTIYAGNAVDVSAVKKALLVGSGEHARLPSTIISGLGGAPRLQFYLPPVTIDQPTICQTGAATLVTAISEIYTTYPQLRVSKPLLCFISTGGMHRGEDDVPWVTQMLYRFVLSIPHKDKKAMEHIFCGEEGSNNFRSVIGVKPTLLTNGPELGSKQIRVGRKQKPAVGYTVSRKDVGAWIYRVVLLEDGKEWEGEMVTITY